MYTCRSGDPSTRRYVPLPLFVPGSSESAQESATGVKVSVGPADALVTRDAVANPATRSASIAVPETKRWYKTNRLYMAAVSSLPGMSGGSPVCDQSRCLPDRCRHCRQHDAPIDTSIE
jgi:hypothetical protein